MRYILYGMICLVLVGCHHSHQENMALIQLKDRHGVSETISNKDRLAQYEQTNFLSSQPYEKVVRVFGRNKEGRQKSIITSYHDNGMPRQYLEAYAGRACGDYREWYPNGVLKIEAKVIEGIADLSEGAELTWLFDGVSRAFDEQGRLKAECNYTKGRLSGDTLHYYPNGKIQKLLHYMDDMLSDESVSYSETGETLGYSTYEKGVRHGKTLFYGTAQIPPFEESYDRGRLVHAIYKDFQGNTVSQIENGDGFQTIYDSGKLHRRIEYQEGLPEGREEIYYASGKLENSYTVHEGKKHGEEWLYFSQKERGPKLFISWYEDEIHGIVKTWYETGSLESQKEMAHNQRQGMLTAWYENGDLMLVEEYENDKLISGQYYKRGNPRPVANIDKGSGIAMLYDKDGIFLKKVAYKNSEIVQE